MALIDSPMFALLEHVMRFQNRRQDALSTNIANASTPGYRSFDLVLAQAQQAEPPLAPRRLDGRHLAGADDPQGVGARLLRSRARPRLDGNNVVIDQEFVRLIENQTRYLAALELRERLGALVSLAREVR